MLEKTSIDEKAEILYRYIKSLKDFYVVDSMDGDYGHMGATITDAMLQAGVKYSSVVKPRVNRLLEHFPQAKTTSGFLELLQDVGADKLLNWKHPEKLQRIISAAKFFMNQGIETEADLKDWLQKPQNITRLKQLRGVGEKTADYFKILVGIPAVAMDRHLFAFLEKAQLNGNDYRTAQMIISRVSEKIGVKSSYLDHSIWKYMSTGKETKTQCARKT